MTVGKYIGIDLGGTKIAGVLADAGGTVLHREQVKAEGAEEVVAGVFRLIRVLLAQPVRRLKDRALYPKFSDLKAGVVIEAPT